MIDFSDAKTALLAALGIVAVAYIVALAFGLRRRWAAGTTPRAATVGGVATGFVTNFFDTLGIGSFASTTATFRFTRMVPDEQIPGTLNVGHTLPTIVQAFIFTTAVPVDSRTLLVLIGAAVAGSWIGAGFVVSWSRRRVQIGMGFALLAAAALMLLAVLEVTPPGGEAIGLGGGKLVFAAAVNFGLGALMTLGIGLYAPCLILISLLGMNPKAAFPIMMGSCAFLMPVASVRFIRENGFDPRAALGLLIGGIPAVLIAAFIVKSLPLTMVRWLVVVVVIYTAAGLLRAARRERTEALAAIGAD